MKKEKDFGGILSDSWKEYKTNWKTYGKIMLLYIIPFIIFFLIELFFMRDILFYKNIDDGKLSSTTVFSLRFLLYVLFSIIVTIFSIWAQVSIIYNSLYKKKVMNVKDSILGGKKYFWRYVGLVLLILIIFMAIALIVGIIFAILILLISLLGTNPISIIIIIFLVLLVTATVAYLLYLGINWTFSVYILIGENKEIWESLKLSKSLVKGRWWLTFGYLILFVLIIMAVYIVIMVIALLINIIINPGYLTSLMTGNFSVYSNIFLVNQIISTIFSLIISLVMTPFSVVFIKNFYLSWKSSKA